MTTQKDSSRFTPSRWRIALVAVGLAVMVVGLGGRALQIQLTERAFLLSQGDSRYLRTAAIPAHRGMITDRFGEPLAISSPVHSVWADPGRLEDLLPRLPELARVLGRKPSVLRRELEERAGREFHYLKRHVSPEVADAVRELRAPGVGLQREYRRFYPSGEVTGHLLGFTGIDDHGLEGLELAFDDWLSGEPGKKLVVRDRLGRTVETVEQLEPAKPGRDLRLSLDRRLQFIAYRELKAAVQKHSASSGSVVLLDARSGEVLAMASQPAFNPNRRGDWVSATYRNRAVTDVFEPGSTLKPFTIAAALASGQYGPNTPVDTAPGVMRVGGNAIRDARNYGALDVARVIQKSSNVGAAKIALSLEPGSVWEVLARAGLGRSTGSGIPGEVGGHLRALPSDRPIERATLAFGYGVSTTALGLARAYTAIARGGTMVPPTVTPRDGAAPAGERVMSASTARALRAMMERVVGPEGTAERAEVEGYRVAGKTGTVKKAIAGGYAEDRYVALFAGMAPASDPRFVAVVIIKEPSAGGYYGGLVAAPVFQRIMEGALRLYNVTPDAEPAGMPLMADAGGAR